MRIVGNKYPVWNKYRIIKCCSVWWIYSPLDFKRLMEKKSHDPNLSVESWRVIARGTSGRSTKVRTRFIPVSLKHMHAHTWYSRNKFAITEGFSGSELIFKFFMILGCKYLINWMQIVWRRVCFIKCKIIYPLSDTVADDKRIYSGTVNRQHEWKPQLNVPRNVARDEKSTYLALTDSFALICFRFSL
jgi:hypothetical protein